jgi:acetolactate synthase I/II/III large subunit
MLVSDYILKFLYEKKVKDVFLLTGGAASFIVDAFSRQNKIKFTCVGHEQSSAMMADAYSRVGPNFSATLSSSGPGGQNLVTGIACSWFDSIPVMHITGNVNTYESIGAQKGTNGVRQIGFQETDVVSMVKPITKYAVKIKSDREIAKELEKAYQIAISGRPGPVLIDIPMDIQKKKIRLKDKKKKIKTSIKFKVKKTESQKIDKIINLINRSSRPVLLIGGGVRISNSVNVLEKIIRKLKIPLVTTWSGVDSVDHYNENFIGTAGVYGTRPANFTIQNSDLLICLGTRLETRLTGGKPNTFAKKSKIIVVDIDKNELSKKRGININIAINMNLNSFLPIFNQKLKIKNANKWNQWKKICKNWNTKYPIIDKKYYSQNYYVNPYVFLNKLSKHLKNNDIIVSATGAHLTWAMQALKLKRNQRMFSAFGNSPMGYALPGSIGACIAKGKKKRIICLDGDGSLQINLQELQTINYYKLPIKIVLMNNSGYGIIKQFKELYLKTKRDLSWKGISNPNFKKLSKTYKIKYFSILNNKNIDSNLKKFLNQRGAGFLEVKISPNQKIIPKVTFGDSIENTYPYLPKKELKKNMIKT